MHKQQPSLKCLHEGDGNSVEAYKKMWEAKTLEDIFKEIEKARDRGEL